MTKLSSHRIDVLEAFCAIYEYKSLSQVVKLLGIKRTTLYSSLDVLKKSLQDQLFLYIDGMYVPTKLADKIYPDVKLIVDAIRRIDMDSKSVRYELGDKKIRIACVPEIIPLLARMMVTVHGVDENIEIFIEQIEARTKEDQLKRLINTDIDIFIDYNDSNYERFKRVPLYTGSFSLVFSEDFDGIELDELIRKGKYITTWNPDIDIYFKKKGARSLVDGVHSPETIKSLIFNGEYYTVLPSIICEKWSQKTKSQMIVKTIPFETDNFKFALSGYFTNLQEGAKHDVLKGAIIKSLNYQA